MLRTHVLISVCLLGSASLLPLHGQQPSPAPNEFHVDGHCRLYETVSTPKGPKVHRYKDRGICSVDSVHETTRTETDMDLAQRKRNHVVIREHTFTFHNPTSEPAAFVLEQALPNGWEIDSDPQPNKIESGTATYIISVGPKQTVNLHVGERNPPS